jgi:outer membrane protein insertion porin family
MIQRIYSNASRLQAVFLVLFLVVPFFMPASVGAQASKRIAVLPFRIHTPEPMDHLVVALQEMVTARLAKEGFSLVDPARVNKSELSQIPLSDLDLLRKRGREQGIDWLVLGSFTQIGGTYSIDLTGMPMSLEREPFSFFVVGERMDTVNETIERAAETMKNRIQGVMQIASIAIEGNKRIETDAILAVIESQQGAVYDSALLDKDLRSIYQMGFFDNVQIDAEEGPTGRIVAFKVSEKPSIGKITFKGNEKIEREDLMEVLGVKKYSIFNRNTFKDSLERLRDHYHQEGYYNVEIQGKIDDLPNNEVALIYDIEEGKKVYIREIKFVGNDSFDDDDLEDVMEISEKGFFSFITDSGQLDRKKLDGDTFRIKTFYHNHGYIKVQVGEPTVSYKKEEGLVITITINEGPQYAIGKVSVDGDLIKDANDLYQELKITKEKVYNREVIRSDVLKLSEIYSDEGYAFVEVSPQIKEDDAAHIVDITYRISKGNKVRFERILITGNDKTRDKVIRRELRVVEGGYFSGKELKKSNQNLHRLGFFEEIKVETKKGSSDSEMTLTVDVKERPTGMFSIGAGYSSVEKVIGMMEIAQNNLFGTGQSLSGRFSVSSLATRYTVSFVEPWLFGKPLSAGIDLYNWEYEWDEYTKDSYGGRVRFGFPLGLEFMRGSVAYTYDDSEISDVSETAAQVIKDVQGRNLTSSITLGVQRDSRDRRFNAKEGSVNSFYVEYAGGFLGGDSYFTKYNARSAWFFPLFWDTSFSVQGKWGYVAERSGGNLPVYEKFRLGGMNTVRGFDYGSISPVDPETGDRIGGEKMMVYNLEFRFPLLKEEGIVGVLFFDAGNVFTKDEDYTFSGIRRSAGAGIRWYSPVGPLRLEWGYNLDQREGEAQSNWEFTIGTPF